MGTPKRVPLILGNPHLGFRVRGLALRVGGMGMHSHKQFATGDLPESIVKQSCKGRFPTQDVWNAGGSKSR